MNRLVHFEFASPDPAKEMEFFGSVFGWKFEPWGDSYWLVETGKDEPGINGGFMPLQMAEQPRVVDTIGVDDIDAAIAKATAAGATMALEKQEMPNVGWTAYLMSPTGIMFGLYQAMPGGEM